ncbi:hypothetical protein LCGC14_1803440 [marine sediment metagenome]|uniref:Uncharacterized protein n=1 Tax=marine sediment metagenome TaxID=412755 RepID=A0A0F9GNT3_9ZZZZ
MDASFQSLFLPILYIIYTATPYEGTISKSRIVVFNPCGKLCKGAQEAFRSAELVKSHIIRPRRYPPHPMYAILAIMFLCFDSLK